MLSEEGQEVVRRYYEEKMEGWPDVMRIWWVSRLLGCSVTTVSKLCQGRKLKAFYIEGAYRIPKECLIDYLVSKEYRCRRKNTQKQLKHEEKLEELLRNQQKENEGCSGQQALLSSEESFSEASSPAVVSDRLKGNVATREQDSAMGIEVNTSLVKKLLETPEAAELLKALLESMEERVNK